MPESPTAQAALGRNLLVLAKAFARARSLELTSVGKAMYGDDQIFLRLQRGEGSFTARKYDEAVARFRAQWPEGAAWPALAEIVPPRRKTPKAA